MEGLLWWQRFNQEGNRFGLVYIYGALAAVQIIKGTCLVTGRTLVLQRGDNKDVNGDNRDQDSETVNSRRVWEAQSAGPGGLHPTPLSTDPVSSTALDMGPLV